MWVVEVDGFKRLLDMQTRIMKLLISLLDLKLVLTPKSHIYLDRPRRLILFNLSMVLFSFLALEVLQS